MSQFRGTKIKRDLVDYQASVLSCKLNMVRIKKYDIHALYAGYAVRILSAA